MKTQQSYQQRDDKGTLYLVATPIGNLEDVTFRAIRTLKEVDQIAAEDTRQTKKLLNHFDIATKLVSYHEHNKETMGKRLIDDLIEGRTIALVSDAGMPAISDPGYELVVSAIKEGIAVIPIPGANAAVTALIASGLPTESFQFIGFLPRQKKQRRQALEETKPTKATLIFYESPYRLKDTLDDMLLILGNRHVSICRELTKTYEEFLRGTLEEAVHWAREATIKGEFCLIVEGNGEKVEPEEVWWESLSPVQHVEHYIALGFRSKEAIKQVATDRGVPKRDIYNIYHQE